MTDNECFEEARKRISYELGFRRDTTRDIQPINQFGQVVLTQSVLEDAHDPQYTQLGEWLEDAPDVDTPEEAVDALFCAAIAEAVHEVCEWFKVDGKPLVNPHDAGAGETAIYNEAHEAAENILSAVR